MKPLEVGAESTRGGVEEVKANHKYSLSESQGSI